MRRCVQSVLVQLEAAAGQWGQLGAGKLPVIAPTALAAAVDLSLHRQRSIAAPPWRLSAFRPLSEVSLSRSSEVGACSATQGRCQRVCAAVCAVMRHESSPA